MADDLKQRLRDCSESKQSEAWMRIDGGQDLCIGAMLADEAADRIEALEAQLAAEVAHADRLNERLREMVNEPSNGFAHGRAFIALADHKARRARSPGQ